MSKYKNNGLTFRFLISYFVILFIPLFLGLFSYEISFNAVEDSAKEKNIQLLKQSMNIIDVRLKEAENIADQALLNPTVKSFQYVKNPYVKDGPYKIRLIKDTLLQNATLDKFLYSYYIIFKESNIVISQEAAGKLSDFYGYVIEYKDMSYETWYKEVLGVSHSGDFMPAAEVNIKRSIIDADNVQSVITYMKSVGYTKNSNAVMLMFIDNNEIKKLFGGIDVSKGGFIYVLDEGGEIISSISNEKNQLKPIAFDAGGIEAGAAEMVINGSKMLVTYTVSLNNGWRYVAAQPVHVVMQKVESIKNLTVTIALISLLFGIGISLYLSFKNAGPISRLVDITRTSFHGNVGKKVDAFALIEKTFSELVMDNEEMKNALKEQKPLIRNVFLDRLFKGGLNSEKDVCLFMNHVDIKFEGACFASVILLISGYNLMVSDEILKELDKKRVVINDVLRKYEKDIYIIHNMEEDKIFLILSFAFCEKEENEKSIERIVNSIENELKGKYRISIDTAIGGFCDSITDIARSVEQARQVLYYKTVNRESGEMWYKNLPNETKGYFYPIEVEVSLINNTKSGNDAKVRSIICEVFEGNFSERKLSIGMIRRFVNEMQGTVIKLIEQVALNGEQENTVLRMVKEMKENSHADEMKEMFIGIYMQICDFVNERKKSHNIKLLQEIKKYIEESYMKHELSLTAVSAEFKLSEVYISCFFKEQTGENFFSYAENIRMIKARELLEQSELNINCIAEKVGYSSAYSFGRAFKRKFGMSPSEYRVIPQKA